jgi:hypothetical protein
VFMCDRDAYYYFDLIKGSSCILVDLSYLMLAI